MMDIEIPVDFKGQQKWITGLSRGTTCDDVIYALLRHDLGPNQNIDVSAYRMYEEWKDCERTLSGRTKVMKLWRALGSEARNVRLVIRIAHSADILDTGSEMSYGTRTRRAKRQSKTHSPFKHQHKLSSMSKSEIYDYYYRKEKRRREIDHSIAHENIEEVYSYVAMVSKQQHQLEHITNQMAAIDASISQYEEAQIYSTLTYPHALEDFTVSSSPSIFPAIKANDIEAYLRMCESLVELHETIEQTHSKACYLASMVMQQKGYKQNRPQAPANGVQLQHTIRMLHEELDQCSALAMSQQNEVELLEEALYEYDRQIQEKQDFILELSRQIQEEEQYHTVGMDILNDINKLQEFSVSEKSTQNASKFSQFSHKSSSNNELNKTHDNTNNNPEILKSNSQNQSHPPIRQQSSPTLISEYLEKRNSATKDLNERSKGVRFKLDVTKWMYDVLSEDDSQWENGGPDILPNKQYSHKFNPSSTSPNIFGSTIISKPSITSNNSILAANKKNITATTLQQASMIPYTTYIRSGGNTHIGGGNTHIGGGNTHIGGGNTHISGGNTHIGGGNTHISGADDSNSDTGLSSMNSEEDSIIPPLETLV